MRLLASNWLVATGLAAAITLLAPSIVIVIAITFIGIPIAIALMLAPLVFMVSLGGWFGGRSLALGRTGYVLGAGATLLVLAIPPALINPGLETRAAAFAAHDLDALAKPLRAEVIAILHDQPLVHRRDQSACDGLCMRLLLNGTAKRVLVAQQSIDIPPVGTNDATSFRFEARDACPAVSLGTGNDEIKDTGGPRSYQQKFAHELMQLEIAKGNCLIEETVALSTADVVISRGTLHRGRSRLDAGLDPFADTLFAYRLSVHVRGDGGFREAYRRTSVVTHPLAPVLAPTVEGGAELRAYAVFARLESRRNLDSEYGSEPDWSDFLTKKLGLQLALKDASATQDTRRLLAEVVSREGPLDKASVQLGHDFLAGVSRSRKMTVEDHILARQLLTDTRFSVPSSAWAAIRYANQPGDTFYDLIAMSMFRRLSDMTSAEGRTPDPAKKDEARSIAAVLRELPASTILNHRRDLEWLARQEQLRVWSYQALVRLHEFGADAAPTLLWLIDEAVRLKGAHGSDWNNAYLAGLIGLCHMGAAGREMIRPIFERLDSGAMVKHASYWDLTIETLVGMGADPDEMWNHLQTADRNHTRSRFDRLAGRAVKKRDCSY
jgi:hypothetical protein